MRQERHGTAARRGIRLHGSTAAAMQKIVIGGIDPSSFAETFDLETEIQSGSKHLDESGEGLTGQHQNAGRLRLVSSLFVPYIPDPAIEAEERRKILLRTHAQIPVSHRKRARRWPAATGCRFTICTGVHLNPA